MAAVLHFTAGPVHHLNGHYSEHDAFMHQYVRFSVEVEAKGATALVAMRISNWLTTWLREHVTDQDGALNRFLKAVAGSEPTPTRAAASLCAKLEGNRLCTDER